MQSGALCGLSHFAKEACTTQPLSCGKTFECTVDIIQVLVTTLLDSGSMVTLVHDTLVSEVALMIEMPWVVCLNGNTSIYPLVSVSTKTNSGAFEHKVRLVGNLVQPVIVEYDFTKFLNCGKL